MIGLAALGLASKVYGNIKSAQANKEAQRQLNDQFQENEAFFNNRAHKDFLETNAAKGAVELLRKKFDKDNKTINHRAAVTGATAENVVAQKGKSGENYNDAVNRIGQAGTYYQNAQENSYRRTLSDLYRQRTALNQQKAQNAANLSASGGELLSTAAEVGGLNEKKKGSGSIFGITPENRTKLNDIAKKGVNEILTP